MARKSIKAKVYKKNKFENSRNYLKLNFKYPEFNILAFDGYFVPDVNINSIFVLPKLSK
jgi:hypothetical protein